MGRTPMSGGTAFRFLASEVAAMEKALEDAAGATPARSVVEGLADQFTNSSERANQRAVAWKQVWNWFQNRRHAQKAKIEKSKTVEIPSAAGVTPVAGLNPDVHRSNPIQGSTVRKVDVPMDFEAKSARDGAWYDVSAFIDKRNLGTDLPEVKVRFAGFGSEEDEWVNISTAVRQRSLPCETTECVAVLPGDLILCFQEGSEQALYYDADILDVQRRRHDVRGCRCRFWVRYRHDQTEEVVPLRKVCRRPETEQRLQLAREGLKLGGTPNIKAAAQAPPLTPATPAQPSSAFNVTPNLYTGLSTTPYTPVQQTPGLQPIPMQSMMSTPDTRPSPTQQQAVPSSVAQAHSTTPIGTQSAALPSIESSMTRQLNISAPAQQTPAGAEPNVPGTEPTAIVKPEVASTEPAEPSDQAQPMDGVSFTPAAGAAQGSRSAEVDLPSETNAATNIDLPAVDEATRVGEAPVDEAARVGEAPVGEAARAGEGPVDEAARVGEAPVDEAPRVGEVPVDEAARVGEAPVDEAPRVGEVPVDEAMRVEEAPVDEAARVGETPVDEAIRVEEAPVDEAARVGETPVDEAKRVEEALVAAAPESILPM